MRGALERGLDLLRDGASALDAVVAAVASLEDDPLFNAGYGSALNAEGAVEMDASVMAWPMTELAQNNPLAQAQSGAGAVAAVSRVRNPILLARAVMETTPHVLMVGAGAERLASAARIARCRPEDLIAERARLRWRNYHARRAHGTVGAAALDGNGQVAAATSTGGLTGKLAGRVGDSAIIGAGTFAHPLGAASATGMGESIMKFNLCQGAVGLLEEHTPMRAATRSIAQLGNLSGAEAGLIMVDRRGRLGYAHNARAMEIAYYSAATGLHHRRLER
jgi:beta-aspartyl-peptidase (threonine type)